jgi:hypothetical protein
MAKSIEVELVFKNAAGKRKIINIVNPKEQLTKVDAEKAMQDIITANIFNSNGGDLTGIAVSRQRTTELQDLA